MPGPHQVTADVLPGPNQIAGGFLRQRRQLSGPVAVVYEAGPTRYGLARFMRGRQVRCVVAAPSKMQRPSGDRVKTDARDALLLARLLRLGEIVEVAVPQPAEDHFWVGGQPGPEHLTCVAIDAARHHRPCVHIQTDARTLTLHRGLPQCRHYRPGSPRPATHDNLAREAPSRVPGTSIPSSRRPLERHRAACPERETAPWRRA
ncbi:hypothetical protein BH24ACT13_BH24ACT13_11320 [soil metagenome]